LPLIKPRLQVERLRSTAPPSTTAVTIALRARFDQKPSAHAMQISIYSSIQLAKCSRRRACKKCVLIYTYMLGFPAAEKGSSILSRPYRKMPACVCVQNSALHYTHFHGSSAALFFALRWPVFLPLCSCVRIMVPLWVITALYFEAALQDFQKGNESVLVHKCLLSDAL
jgi:hypothetical protein